MIKVIKSWFNVFKWSKFKFGEQHVTQFILFECKYLFSIIFFYFHRCNGTQDRFHTHAFNAVSVRVYGDYVEEFLNGDDITSKKRSRSRFLYIPRDSYHRITRSNGCLTILFSGPWKEWIDGKETTYKWSRDKV